MNPLIWFDPLPPVYSDGLGARPKYVASFAAPAMLAIVLVTALPAIALPRLNLGRRPALRIQTSPPAVECTVLA